MLDYLGLVPAVKALVDDVSRRHGIAITFVPGASCPAVPPDVALCLFRVVQECLNNLARHSRARSAQVRLSGTAEGIHLTIEDDGIGFDVARLERHVGLGFVSIRERLRPLQGRVRIDSAAGSGTRIDVDVPLTPAGVHALVPGAAALDSTPS
jgi:signal transduction histidine kinase